MTASDLARVRRAGRLVAIQTSLALAAVLLLVGVVVAAVFVRAQNAQIATELESVAATADDTGDAPPGMELVLRDEEGHVSTSAGGKVGVPLLDGENGFSAVEHDGRHYRAFVVDRPEGRVVVLTDLAPYRGGLTRMLGALAFAGLAGIVASVAVVVLFSRRSVEPLAQALALQRRFVADASHELRAPLTVLHTRAQMLARRIDAGDLPAARQDAEAVVADTRVLSGVVDDLLASATLATRQREATRVDLGVVARSVCDSMAAHATSIGVTLTCQARAGGLIVIGSEPGLRRVLTALVDNALGHEHQGGTVELTVQRDGQQVIAAVRDDGVGIDAETTATLFDRLSHGSAHTSRAGRESYGIGLALVREIVQAHGGEIRVASELGLGATFTVSLPAAAADLHSQA